MYFFFYFFVNDTATTEIYTLSYTTLFRSKADVVDPFELLSHFALEERPGTLSRAKWDSRDRKSTRLNSSHVRISYAVFCLKKKKEIIVEHYPNCLVEQQ